MNCALAFAEAPSFRVPGAHTIAPGYTAGFELLCAAVYAVDLRLRAMLEGTTYLRRAWGIAAASSVVAIALNALMTLVAPTVPRLLRVCRPVPVLQRLRYVRRVVSAMVESVRPILSVAVLLVIGIFIFGVLANLRYRNIGRVASDADGAVVPPGDIPSSMCDEVDQSGEFCCRPHPNATRYLFDAHTDYCSVFTQNCMNYFGRLSESFLHLFTLMTTANFPDVMMPVVSCEKTSALFFLLFLALMLYLLLSLVLVVVYKVFQQRTRRKVVKGVNRRAEAIAAAFGLLARPRRHWEDEKRRSAAAAMNSGERKHSARDVEQGAVMSQRVASVHLPDGIQPSQFRSRRRVTAYAAYVRPVDGDVAEGLMHYRSWAALMQRVRPNVPAELLPVLFRMCDTTDSGFLTLRQFQELSSVSEVYFEARLRKPPFPDNDGSLQLGQYWRIRATRWRHDLLRLVYSAPASVFFNSVVLVYVFGIVGAAYGVAAGWSTGVVEACSYMQSTILVVFVAEVCLKIVSKGPRAYWRESVFARVDLIASLGGIAYKLLGGFQVLVAADESLETFAPSKAVVLNALTFLRLARLLKVLQFVKSVRDVIETFAAVLPALLRFFCAAVSIQYMFAVIGMEFFAFVMQRPDVANGVPPDPRVTRLSYGHQAYWSNNFNDLQFSFYTLFELMVVNNWPIIMEAYVSATNWGALTFFLVYYSVVVLMLVNVMVAFLMDLFLTQQGKSKLTQVDDEWKMLFATTCSRFGITSSDWVVRRRFHVGILWEALYKDPDDSEAAGDSDVDDIKSASQPRNDRSISEHVELE